ncbi:MAG TPA: DUF2341 domain-containing protein [Polyangiaceae bacterium]|nr:DUF2341 domain-containing protein [Polyangiaceae bacterium]
MRLYPASLFGCALAFGACRFGYELLPLDEAGGAAGDAGAANQAAAGGNVGGAAIGGAAAGGGGAAAAAGAGGADAAGAGAEAGAADGGSGQPECGDAVMQPTEECEPALSTAEELCQADCSYHWFDRAYAKRRRVTFVNPGATELLGFVVPVVLTANELDYPALQLNGEDLLFVDAADQALLSFELEAFVPGGTSLAWLRFPSVPASGSASAWLYSSNPVATDAQSPAQAWSSGFAAVYHLNGNASDSLGASHGAITGAQTGAAQLAAGLDFNSNDDVVDAGSAGGVDDLFAVGGTLTAWIRPRSWGEGNFGRIVDKASDTLAATGWALQVDGGQAPNHALIFEHGFSGGPGRWNGPDSSIALGAWSHVAVVYDAASANNQPVMYVNGVAQSFTVIGTPNGARASDAPNALGIGDQVATKQRSFDGVLDEVRLERASRSAAWINAEYRSMLPGAVTFSSEQTRL